jgi:hypothetical protein
MKEKECPACALEVEWQAAVCPYCGYAFPIQRRSHLWMVGVMLLLLGIAMLLGWV